MHSLLAFLTLLLAFTAAQSVPNVVVTKKSYNGTGCPPETTTYISLNPLWTSSGGITTNITYHLPPEFLPYYQQPGIKSSDTIRKCDLTIGFQVGKEWYLRVDNLGSYVHTWIYDIPSKVTLRWQGVFSWTGKTNQVKSEFAVPGPFQGLLDKFMEGPHTAAGSAESSCGGGELVINAMNRMVSTASQPGSDLPEDQPGWYFGTSIEVLRCDQKKRKRGRIE